MKEFKETEKKYLKMKEQLEKQSIVVSKPKKTNGPILDKKDFSEEMHEAVRDIRNSKGEER